ncbi:hypothetical protein SDC9_134638 [bioreactor metagenome]|uniref:Uncharacterized protein n=1 Tax=bioreactor metagenome TaxID=1076179 RepID=A0A645DE42_9ZZZZ
MRFCAQADSVFWGAAGTNINNQVVHDGRRVDSALPGRPCHVLQKSFFLFRKKAQPLGVFKVPANVRNFVGHFYNTGLPGGG